MSLAVMTSFDFELPTGLVAHEPPEARGVARDRVRLLVTRRSDDAIVHTEFRALPDFLTAGDVLVVNSSATLNAAFDAVRETLDGASERVLLHLSTPLSEDWWVVELRRVTDDGNAPLRTAAAGETVLLPAGGKARLIGPFAGSTRLWIARLSVPGGVLAYSARFGAPIRYAYVPEQWPLSYYQTMFAAEPGSAEMPSAGRPFTRDVVRRLELNGVQLAPIVLHTGVSSLDADELPYPEQYRVPETTVQAIDRARAAGGRVVAVGTTVVRALETVATSDGRIRAGSGWTDLVVTPERGMNVVDAMLTGLHTPKASHLWMLEALAGAPWTGRGSHHLSLAYEAAIAERYLWHEFGDVHLIV